VKLVLFDLSGTLVRSGGVVESIYRHMLDERGLEVPPEVILSQIGRSKREAIAALMHAAGRETTSGEIEDLVEDFESSLLAAFCASPPDPLPSAPQCIADLRALGVMIGFTTGFSRRAADVIVAHTGWKFDAGSASDEVLSGRPAPDLIFDAMRQAGVRDARDVTACGDTPGDLLAGTHAGCRLVIGVGHGTHSVAELQPYPHTHLVNDLATLPGIVALARSGTND